MEAGAGARVVEKLVGQEAEGGEVGVLGVGNRGGGVRG